LSGQPRAVQVGYQKLYNTVLKYNDVDVFIHTWFDLENLNTNSIIPGREGHTLDSQAIDKLVNYYQPKRIMVEKSKNWKRKYDIPDKCFTNAWTWALEVKDGLEVAKDYICNTTNSMFYSIMMANLLKEQYSVETEIPYDLVIRNRIDYSPHVVLKLDEAVINDDTLTYQDLHQPDGMINDYLDFGGPKAMNAFMSTFCFMESLLEKCDQEFGGAWSNEMLHRKALDIFGIGHQSHPFVVSLPRF
jgi:hypothetical protein